MPFDFSPAHAALQAHVDAMRLPGAAAVVTLNGEMVDEFCFSIQAFSFADDAAMAKLCTRKLLSALPHAPAVLHVLSPADVGMQAIGRAGTFRRSAEPSLWPRLEQAGGG